MGQTRHTRRPPALRSRLSALCATLALGALAAIAPAAHASGAAVQEVTDSGVRAYWTPERMRAAEPVPGPALDPAAPAGRRLAPSGTPALVEPVEPGAAEVATLSGGAVGEPTTRAASLDRDEITDPSAEPFRAHGKVFFTITGGTQPGSYVCSGTAIASANRSVVWTAGHCAFDTFGGGYASQWMFAPGYHNGATPFGEWPAESLAAPAEWRNDENLSYDLAAAVVSKNPQGQALNDVVGGRGIGFNQARQQDYQSFGYPAEQPPLEFTGGREFRCSSELGGSDNPPGSGPNTNWIPCDMTGGSSGGGWVANGSVLSLNSYSYCIALECEERLYGPYQESTAQSLYTSVAGGTEKCAGKPVTHLGTNGPDRLVGTSGPDVFKALGGDDEVIGKGGKDRVCAGNGKDLVKGNGGKDKLKGQRGRDTLKGGLGNDFCNGGPGRDKAFDCKRTRKVP